jgi:multidrug efflux system outer membrane protein
MMNARRCTLLLAIASSLVLAGCAIKQPPFGADIMPESARAKIPGSWAGPHRSGAVVPNWIRNFGDPELAALVADAVERNPDLKAAAARVEASRAAVRIAASSLYPRIAMKGLGERQGQELGRRYRSRHQSAGFWSSGNGEHRRRWTRHQHGFIITALGIWLAAGAAWEADVWGRIRSKKAAARAESAALEADYEFARQSLAAAVARAYFTTIEAAQQEANAQETLDIYQEYSKLTDQRKQQGFASDFDVSQIKSRTAAAEDALYCRTGGPGADDPRDRGRDQPLPCRQI